MYLFLFVVYCFSGVIQYGGGGTIRVGKILICIVVSIHTHIDYIKKLPLTKSAPSIFHSSSTSRREGIRIRRIILPSCHSRLHVPGR